MPDLMQRKNKKTYTFTVEGETERWYLERLEALVNEQCDNYTVKITPTVEKNPASYVKHINRLSTPLVVHLCDYEGKSANDEKQFLFSLDKLKEANSNYGGNFRYELGYSNLTFELWIILHKRDCNGHLTDKQGYISLINKAYGTSFSKLANYKEESNFKKLLSKLTLEDVKSAIIRAERIMQQNKENGLHQKQRGRFKYYEDNPSLTIWESIKRILKECELM